MGSLCALVNGLEVCLRGGYSAPDQLVALVVGRRRGVIGVPKTVRCIFKKLWINTLVLLLFNILLASNASKREIELMVQLKIFHYKLYL